MKKILYTAMALVFVFACATEQPAAPARGNDVLLPENPNRPDLSTQGSTDPTSDAVSGTLNALIRSGKKKSAQQGPKISGICKADGLPCQSFLLSLKNHDGQEISETRTAPDGSFVFYVPAGTEYTIEAKSAGYQAHLEPATWISSGTETSVSLLPRR